MLKSSAGMPTHLILAIEHHNQLVEDARRYREALAMRRLSQERPLRWRRLRIYAGDWLINMGQRLKSEPTTRHAANTA